MCFSPVASFTAAAVLLGIGAVTYHKAEKDGEKLFAAIPLLFFGQQLLEGLLWLALLHGHAGRIAHLLTQGYAVFAGIIWPVFVPLSLLQIESKRLNKAVISLALIAGLLLAGYAFYVVARFGVTSQIAHACILYGNPDRPSNYQLLITGYVLATCLPFLFVRQHLLKAIGFLFFAAFAVSIYLYKYAFVSAWCFFASLVSGTIYFYFRKKETDAMELARSQELIPPFLTD